MLAGGNFRQLAKRAVCVQTHTFANPMAPISTSQNLFTAPTKAQRQQPTSSRAKTELARIGPSNQTPTTTTTRPDELQDLRPARPLFYHDQMEWLDERLVRISRPTKNVMQSGTAYTNCWKIEFDSQPRSEYWLMGWTGTTDPMSNTVLTFPTKESAIAFCERNKLQWFLEEQPERKTRRKSYADNFSWNKRTRNGTK